MVLVPVACAEVAQQRGVAAEVRASPPQELAPPPPLPLPLLWLILLRLGSTITTTTTTTTTGRRSTTATAAAATTTTTEERVVARVEVRMLSVEVSQQLGDASAKAGQARQGVPLPPLVEGFEARVHVTHRFAAAQ